MKKALVLSPSLGSIGGVQSYTRTLASALEEILGTGGVRLLEVGGEPQVRRDGTATLTRSVKLRFAIRAMFAAIAWRPDLVIATHIGVAPVAQLIKQYINVPYWLLLHGIEVWGELPPMKVRALRGAARYVVLSRFALDATVMRHALSNPAVVLLPPPLEVPAQSGPRDSGDSATPLHSIPRRPSSLRWAGLRRPKGTKATTLCLTLGRR